MENETKQEIDIEEVSAEITLNVLKFIFIKIPATIVLTLMKASQLVLNGITLILVATCIAMLAKQYPELHELVGLMWLGVVAFAGTALYNLYEVFRTAKEEAEEDSE